MTVTRERPAIQHVCVIGTGLMGTGIVQVALSAGYKVTMVGRNNEKVAEARQKVLAGLAKAASRKHPDDIEKQNEILSAQQSALSVSTSQLEAVKEADIVLEAVVENLKVKQRLFADILPHIKKTCIIVTNTSSFRLGDVCPRRCEISADEPVQSLSDEERTRFAGLHFFNPVPAMKLVEVISAEETASETTEALAHFCKQIGKTPVMCKDTAGFIVNRLLIPYLLDAFRMAERGDAGKRDIDTAMKLGTGHPMGPFELSDYIGLDTIKFVTDGWHQAFPENPAFTPVASLDTLVAEGKLGKKSREGFYKY